MAVITISRELAALGDETAKELSRLSGYRFIDRKIIERRIAGYGVSDKDLKKYDERKPTFFSALSRGRDDYLHYLKTALLEEAGDGKCIFIGRGACVVFKRLPDILPVLLVSPIDVRIERVRGYFRCDEKKARDIITRSDNDRHGFYNYFFDTQWRDSANYTLTLNTASLTPATCAALIEQARLLLCQDVKEAETKKRLHELALAQKVVHHIVYEKSISVHFLDVSMREGTAVLYGVAGTVTHIDSALKAAVEVDGVESAESEIQLIRDYTVFH
jgi:cytidylate kinase